MADLDALVILWLYKRIYDGKPIGSACIKLMKYVFQRAKIHDLSFETASDALHELFEKLDSVPITDEQMQKSRQLLDTAEDRRQEHILAYAEQKLKHASTNAV